MTPAGPPALLESPSRQPASPRVGLPPLHEHPVCSGAVEQLPHMKQEQQEDVVAALFGLSQPSAIAT